MRNCFFTPEVIAEICGELGVPFRTNGYRQAFTRGGESLKTARTRARQMLLALVLSELPGAERPTAQQNPP